MPWTDRESDPCSAHCEWEAFTTGHLENFTQLPGLGCTIPGRRVGIFPTTAPPWRTPSSSRHLFWTTHEPFHSSAFIQAPDDAPSRVPISLFSTFSTFSLHHLIIQAFLLYDTTDLMHSEEFPSFSGVIGTRPASIATVKTGTGALQKNLISFLSARHFVIYE
jgi:hypothetical protein